MWGTRKGWMAVLEGAQKVVDGVAWAAKANRNAGAINNLFIVFSLGKTLPRAPREGRAGPLGAARAVRCRSTGRTRAAWAAAAPGSAHARSCCRSMPR